MGSMLEANKNFGNIKSDDIDFKFQLDYQINTYQIFYAMMKSRIKGSIHKIYWFIIIADVLKDSLTWFRLPKLSIWCLLFESWKYKIP